MFSVSCQGDLCSFEKRLAILTDASGPVRIPKQKFYLVFAYRIRDR
jgi:hypothetical protein